MSSNSFLRSAGRSRFLKRPLALLLALVLLLALLPELETAADAAYYDEAIQKLIGWDVLRGYPDGSLNPDGNITRAEFVALINRAYGYGDTTTIPFNDVPDTAWYHDDISAAYAAGYFTGTSPITATPSGELTREQAMVLLARNMRLEENSGEVTGFSDGRSFRSYSAGYANTAVEKGLISGYSDGSFRPDNSITRGEMAVMLSRALGNLVGSEGTYALGSVFGNVTVNSPNVTLRDTTIAGDLYLTGGLGLGGMTLENVRVLGDIIVAGGGESDEGESVILRNVTADSIRVDTLLGEYVSLRAEGNTNIGEALLVTDSYVQDRTASGQGFQLIRMEGENGEYSLSGNLEKVVNAAPYSMLRVSQGTVQDLAMDEAAVGASLWLDSSATVHNLVLDTATAVEGRGDVRKLNVNVAGTNTEMLPDDIEVRPGLTGVIGGENMDSAAAAEASSEPRIQANYPRMINVAATSATATFSTNKSGTIYWAVTAVSDGSVDEEALLAPGARSSILKSGNLSAALSNTVYSVNITGLTSGGIYYLSAMLVDARGDYSPVKVVAFTTTDNTIPAFGSGFPYMSEINDTNALVTVMATKNCQLYWVVFDKGSAAPTAASFRAGAFSGAYGYGVRDMRRNISETFEVNNLELLEELGRYDVYFWLNDADSAKSSAVKKLSFTTVDRTPPKFNTEPTVTNIATTSLRLTTNLNEAGTVYWVIVESSEDYPKQPNTSIREMPAGPEKQAAYEDYFKLQIANGMNGLKAGSVKVRANVDATINITGLQGETQYKIFYIARDTAGNYSDIKTELWIADQQSGYELVSNFLVQSTLDLNAPTVTQEFTRYRGTASTQPYADTSIRIVFNEPVQRYSDLKPLLDAYTEVTRAGNDEEQLREAKEALADLLRSTIKLFPSAGNETVRERTAAYENDDWVIDYRNATVTVDGRKMIVTFPTVLSPDTGEPTEESALHLNSDATYYFQIEDIADTSDRVNQMGITRLDRFTTIAAQVDLAGVNLAPPQIKTTEGGQVEVHAVYSMTPVSVSMADPGKSWDMLIWANKNVTFQLYSQVQKIGMDPVDGEWEVVTTLGEEPDGGVESVGVITIPLDYNEEYKGLSYWLDLRNAGYNPSIRHEEYGLEDNNIYYYAIRLTEIEGENPDVWSGNVNFWITVNTGSDNDFRSLWASGMSESGYGSAINPDMPPPTLTEISVSPDGSDRFIRTASFADKIAPEFDTEGGFPELTATDTSLTARLRLNRAGTVYWVVAEAGEIPTTRRDYSVPVDSNGQPPVDDDGQPFPDTYYDVGSTVGFSDLDVPISGRVYPNVALVHFYDQKDGTPRNYDGETDYWEWYPLYLKLPIPSSIYNPRFSNSAIKYGSSEVDGNSTKTIQIDGLTANKEYYIYFVIKGTSSVYSDNVQVYKFHTEEAYRPNIVLERPGPQDVAITSMNMDAAVEYALFYMDRLGDSPLGRTFASSDVMSAENIAAYLAEVGNTQDENGVYLKDYTVLQAMQREPSSASRSYDSYFDKYADPTYKMSVYNFVTSRASSGIYVGGTGGTPVSLTRERRLEIDCDTFNIEPGVNYCFVTVSRYLYAVPEDLSGNSYSFHAQSPIFKADYEKPQLISILGNITVDYTNGKTANPDINGNIIMLFDKDLYYLDEAVTQRYPIYQTVNVGSSGYKLVTDLNLMSNNISIVPSDSVAANMPTRQIFLEMTDTSGFITLQDSVIASEYSSAIGLIDFSVNLNTSPDSGNVTQQAEYTFNYDTDTGEGIWQSAENVRIVVNVKSDAPKARSLSLSNTSLSLGSEASVKELTATVRFDAPSNFSEVVWSVADGSIISVSPSTTYYDDAESSSHSTHTVSVTALSAGTTTITARCGDLTATCTVTVSPYAEFSEGEVSVVQGRTRELSDLLLINIPASEILSTTWESNSEDVGVGMFTGQVKGVVAGGSATITVTVRTRSGDVIRAMIDVVVTSG